MKLLELDPHFVRIKEEPRDVERATMPTRTEAELSAWIEAGRPAVKESVLREIHEHVRDPVVRTARPLLVLREVPMPTRWACKDCKPIAAQIIVPPGVTMIFIEVPYDQCTQAAPPPKPASPPASRPASPPARAARSI